MIQWTKIFRQVVDDWRSINHQNRSHVVSIVILHQLPIGSPMQFQSVQKHLVLVRCYSLNKSKFSSKSFSFGKSILHEINVIDLLGRMFRTFGMFRSWFICWSKIDSVYCLTMKNVLRFAFQVYKVRHKEDNQIYAIKRSLTKFRGKSDR